MAEQPIEQTEHVETSITPTTHEQHESDGMPKGAVAFAILMLIGYAFYFFMIWSEVIARGGR